MRGVSGYTPDTENPVANWMAVLLVLAIIGVFGLNLIRYGSCLPPVSASHQEEATQSEGADSSRSSR